MDLKVPTPQVVCNPLAPNEWKTYLGQPFSDMVKFVVDTEKQNVALGGELHSDGEALLLNVGSLQRDLWGGNIYQESGQGFRVEYSSMINIRPSSGNRSLEIEDERVKTRILEILRKLLP